jgi:ParB-like chromosome segregation protein Spo0J
MRVETIPIDRIQPYWRNPRKNDAAVEKVRASIERFGFNQPLVVDASLVVIAGHTRLRAARQMGLAEVPVVIADLPPEKAKAYRIADNAAGGISAWEEGSLAKELERVDLAAMATFFRPGELDALLTAPSPEDLEPPAEEPEPPIEPPEELTVTLACPHCRADFDIDARTL